MSSSSFTAKKLNASTVLITEDDAYGEHPYIYVKIHPVAPVLIIEDTGCDKASENRKHGMQEIAFPTSGSFVNSEPIQVATLN